MRTSSLYAHTIDYATGERDSHVSSRARWRYALGAAFLLAAIALGLLGRKLGLVVLSPALALVWLALDFAPSPLTATQLFFLGGALLAAPASVIGAIRRKQYAAIPIVLVLVTAIGVMRLFW